VCRLASPDPQVYLESESDRRHREEASTSTPRRLPTDLRNGITPDTGTKSSLRKFSQFDMSTSNSDSSRGSLSADVGKEGKDLGKLRKESAGPRRPLSTYLQLTFPIPNLAKSGTAMTVCPYDKGTFPRGPRGRKRATVLGKGIVEEGVICCTGNGSTTLYFCTLHLFMGEEGMTFGLFVLSLSKHFICFSKGP